MPTEITIEKTKLGPLLKRYIGGEFRDVEREKDGRKRYALVGLDNSHKSDYKVAYAGDPVTVVSTAHGVTHDQLKDTLQENNMWLDEFSPIELPCNDGWRAGFKSLPRSSEWWDMLGDQARKAVARDMDVMEGDNGLTAYIPA